MTTAMMMDRAAMTGMGGSIPMGAAMPAMTPNMMKSQLGMAKIRKNESFRCSLCGEPV